jgi:hypothetical protein
MRDEKKKSEQERTPITDGDTRPDERVDGSQKKELKRNKASRHFTSNRGSDVNSIEDFKDKKIE